MMLYRLKIARAALSASGLALMHPAMSLAAEARRPTPVAYTVICGDASVRQKLTSRVGELLKAQADYTVSETLPLAELILYANRDADDRINPNGYSIAIAHVSNVKAYVLVKKLLVEKPTKDERVKDVLVEMLRGHGMLEHLNVAHMDAATDREIDLLSRGAVAAFIAATPADAGR